MDMETKPEFAPEWARDDDGYILFGPDTREWRKYFKQETKGHPAPMNLYMIQELVRYYTKPGDRLLDPMAGSGTLGWATTEDRYVVMIELEEEFQAVIRRNMAGLGTSNWVLLCGDCRLYLPLAGTDHIIFSPPYSNIRGQKSKLEEDIHVGTAIYKKSEENIGRLSKFMYGQAMRQVYRGLYNSLRVGGTMTIIIQDFVKGGQLQQLSMDLMRVCQPLGFELLDWHRRYSTTFFRQLTEKQNPNQPKIRHEDIIVLRRKP